MQQPVIDDSLADPFIFQSADLTTRLAQGAEQKRASIATAERDGRASFRCHVSSDLSSWSAAGRALVRPYPALATASGAPEVVAHEGMFYMYYSVFFGDRAHQLRVVYEQRGARPISRYGAALDLARRVPVRA